MRTHLRAVLLASAVLVAGPALAQSQGGGASSGGSNDVGGTTGDLSGRVPSVSDVSSGRQQHQAKPSVDAAMPSRPRTTEQAAYGDPDTSGVGSTTDLPARVDSRGPCFRAAWEFDQRLQRVMGPEAGAQSFADPTRMRNEGMSACQAGRVQEGRRMIEQATAALGS